MSTVHLHRLDLAPAIQPEALAAFRGALIQAAGPEHDLLHQHAGTQTFHYRYPLVQYKIIDHHPAILLIQQAAPLAGPITQALAQAPLQIGTQPTHFTVQAAHQHTFQLALTTEPQTYHLQSWLALNPPNTALWHGASTPTERTALLRRILIGNILAFAKAVDWRIDQTIQASLLDLSPSRHTIYKHLPFLTFDATFTVNLHLPPLIGLGKGASHGHGILTPA